MASPIRIKDISRTVTTAAANEYLAVDGPSGSGKMLTPDPRGTAATAAADAVAEHDASAAAHGIPAVRYVYDLAVNGLTTLSSGATITDGALCASVDGTHGLIALPAWNLKFASGSVKIKASKTATGSISSVDFVNASPGAIPSAASLFIGFGYVAGTGICSIAGSRTSPSNTVIVSDSVLTDGAIYEISFYYDKTIVPASSAGANAGVLTIVVRDSTGAILASSNRSVTLSAYGARNVVIRTNLAAGGITVAKVTINGPAATGGAVSVGTGVFITTKASEACALWLPKTTNGKLVIAAHGHGGSSTLTGYTSTRDRPTWETLAAAGYTICVPDFGGNLWGNSTAQSILASVRDSICSAFSLDRRVALWGDSMGGGLVLTALALNTLGTGMVRAAYLAEPVCDLDVMYSLGGAYSTSLDAAFSSAEQRRAYSPILLPVVSTPTLFAASASDTTVVKASHTTPMVARYPSGYAYQLATSGVHGDDSHFVAANVLSFLAAF